MRAQRAGAPPQAALPCERSEQRHRRRRPLPSASEDYVSEMVAAVTRFFEIDVPFYSQNQKNSLNQTI